MPEGNGTIAEASFIDEPRDDRLKTLFNYWDSLRDGRAMPTRAEFDPTAIPRLLPNVFMYGVAPDGGYTIRLVGEEVVEFVGSNNTGNPAGTVLSPSGAAMVTHILDAVVDERAPKFRAGKAHWHPAKGHRDYEACFLPLATDGGGVSVVLCGLAFPGAGN